MRESLAWTRSPLCWFAEQPELERFHLTEEFEDGAGSAVVSDIAILDLRIDRCIDLDPELGRSNRCEVDPHTDFVVEALTTDPCIEPECCHRDTWLVISAPDQMTSVAVVVNAFDGRVDAEECFEELGLLARHAEPRRWPDIWQRLRRIHAILRDPDGTWLTSCESQAERTLALRALVPWADPHSVFDFRAGRDWIERGVPSVDALDMWRSLGFADPEIHRWAPIMRDHRRAGELKPLGDPTLANAWASIVGLWDSEFIQELHRNGKTPVWAEGITSGLGLPEEDLDFATWCHRSTNRAEDVLRLAWRHPNAEPTEILEALVAGFRPTEFAGLLHADGSVDMTNVWLATALG